MGRLAVSVALLLAAGCAAEDADALAVEIGTHVAGASSPEAYVPLAGEAAVVLGHQGLHMVVLAARLPNAPEATATVEAVLTTASGLEARYRQGHRLQVGADGAYYVLNVFVILDDPDRWRGQTAEVTLTVKTADGTRGQATAALVLVDG